MKGAGQRALEAWRGAVSSRKAREAAVSTGSAAVLARTGQLMPFEQELFARGAVHVCRVLRPQGLSLRCLPRV